MVDLRITRIMFESISMQIGILVYYDLYFYSLLATHNAKTRERVLTVAKDLE